jgi:hypothetical protein
MMMETFPYQVRLGRDRHGELGMVWDENSGGINAMDSVMFSRRSAFGWTERKCLAPGRYPDVNCSSGSLIPGDSTAFIVAYARWEYPDTTQVLVWDLNDSLKHAPTVFQGGQPMLARGQDVRFLVFTRGDSVFASENRGQGWQSELLVATGAGRNAPGLCVDPLGWGWVCWPDSHHQAVLASYNRGSGWSVPETVAVFSALGAPKIASDEFGTVHCAWLDHAVGSQGRLRHAYRFERPGAVQEPAHSVELVGRPPTLVRAVLDKPGSSDSRSILLNSAGQKVTDLRPGRNDIRHLSPGIYFIVPQKGRSVQRVIIAR